MQKTTKALIFNLSEGPSIVRGLLSKFALINKANFYFWSLNKPMVKGSVVLICCLVLLLACNKETPKIPPLPPNQDAPTLDFEFVSVASTTRFFSFGDTLPNSAINKGYRLQLSDTNESIVMACPGIVTAIAADTSGAGGSLITVKFKRNSIYSFTYGGVTRILTQVNDSLPGGALLGKIGGAGIVDFQVITNNNEVICPQTFGSPGFNQAMRQAMLLNNSFNPDDTIFCSCKTQSLPR